MADQAPAPKKSKGVLGLITGLAMAAGAVMVMPLTVVLVVGMVPSFVAFFVDQSRSRSLGPTVTFLNFAGVFPSLLELFRRGHTMQSAIGLLSEPLRLLMILVPPALGWMLFAFTPVVVGAVMRRRAEVRMRWLEREQKILVDQWGDAVLGGAAAQSSALDSESSGHLLSDNI